METLTKLGHQGSSAEEAADKALLDRYRESDDEANFEAIYQRYRGHLRTYAERHLRGEFAADIDDILQATFFQLHRRRAKLPPDTHLRGFLYRVIENKCNDRLRMSVAQRRDHRLTCRGLDMLPDPKARLSGHEQEMYVNELLATLPLKQATALRLTLEGHTAASAAEVMDATEDNVEWWIRDGKRRLREMGQDDRGGEPS